MIDMSLMRPAAKEEVHALLLEAMKYINDICTKEGITYYAAYGTLLGAVREHGFIAWDHDADVWMKREDYNKFSEVVSKYNNSKYFINAGRLTTLMRIYINDTLARRDKSSEYEDFSSRFHVDIFSLDFGFGSKHKDRRIMRTLALMRRIIFRSMGKNKKWKYLKNVRTFKYFTRLMIKSMLPFPARTWENIYRKVLHNDSPDTSVLISTGGRYAPEREIFSADLFAETTELQFGDMMIKCPARYDELLTQIYGDYMTPYKRGGDHSFWVKA